MSPDTLKIITSKVEALQAHLHVIFLPWSKTVKELQEILDLLEKEKEETTQIEVSFGSKHIRQLGGKEDAGISQGPFLMIMRVFRNQEGEINGAEVLHKAERPCDANQHYVVEEQ